MNWGKYIVFGLASFMLFIIGSGVYMVTHDSDSLIDEDYYEHSLTYDDVYSSKQNLVNDEAKPKVILQEDTLHIIFVYNENKGTLMFKRPADGSLDRKIPFYTDNNVFKLPVSSFTKGNWALEINWIQNNKNYIYTQSVYFQ